MSDDWGLMENWDEPAICEHCECELDWERCDQCEDGMSDHDCGEDCCACLYPEPNVVCDQCGGAGGWYTCFNSRCTAKQEQAT